MSDFSRPSRAPVTIGQRRALGVLTLLATAAVFWMAVPVGLGIFLGTLVAFTVEPLYQRLCARLRRPAISALICAIGATFSVAGTIFLLGWAIAQRGAAAISDAEAALSHGKTLSHVVMPLARVARRVGVDPVELVDRLREAGTGAAGRVVSAVGTIATMGANLLLTLFFLALTTYFVLRHWRSLTSRIERMLPLHPRHTRVLFRELRSAGRSILLGTVVTGAAQGVLAAIGFAIFRVPHAPLLGALTAVASLVPAIGTMLVWAPASIWLIASGRVGAGVGLLVWCLLTVIVLSDYVVRPRLVGGDRAIPSLLTFIALFGGVEVFGVVGLVLGPVLVSLAIALLRTWEEESLRRAAEQSEEPPVLRPSHG